MHVMDTLERGVSIIQREMSKNPAFLQDIVTRNMNNVVTALTAVVDAAYEVKLTTCTVLEFATSHKALIQELGSRISEVEQSVA